MKDKFYISAGPMCDMTFLGEKGKAFCYFEDGHWHFDKDLFLSWYLVLRNQGLNTHLVADFCVGSKVPRKDLLMPWQFFPASDAWNMLIFNQDYFDIRRQIGMALTSINVVDVAVLSNECHMHGTDRQAQTAHYHNLNGVRGIYDSAALPFHGAFAGKLIGTLKDLKLPNGEDGVMFVIGNELNHKGGAEVGYAIIPELVAADIKPWNILLGACMPMQEFLGYVDPDKPQTWYKNETNSYAFIDKGGFSNADLISHELVKQYEQLKNPDGTQKYPNVTHQRFNVVHNLGAPQKSGPLFIKRIFGEAFHQKIDWWVKKVSSSNRVWASSDGASPRPSVERWKAMILFALKAAKNSLVVDGRPKYGFDYLPEGQSISQIAMYVAAMSDVHLEIFGEDTENRKHPLPVPVYPPVPPTPPAPPPPEPEPELEPKIKQPINLKGEWANNKWQIIAGAVATLVFFGLLFYRCC